MEGAGGTEETGTGSVQAIKGISLHQSCSEGCCWITEGTPGNSKLHVPEYWSSTARELGFKLTSLAVAVRAAWRSDS